MFDLLCLADEINHIKVILISLWETRRKKKPLFEKLKSVEALLYQFKCLGKKNSFLVQSQFNLAEVFCYLLLFSFFLGFFLLPF